MISFTAGSTATFIIRLEKRSVDTVSSMCRASGQMLAIMAVMQLPPIESFRMCVSLD